MTHPSSHSKHIYLIFSVHIDILNPNALFYRKSYTRLYNYVSCDNLYQPSIDYQPGNPLTQPFESKNRINIYPIRRKDF